MPKPKPDDRSDNVRHLQTHLENTYENVEDAEDYLRAHRGEIGPKQVAQVRAKNRRRREAIEGFREEIVDEAHRFDDP